MHENTFKLTFQPYVTEFVCFFLFEVCTTQFCHQSTFGPCTYILIVSQIGEPVPGALLGPGSK